MKKQTLSIIVISIILICIPTNVFAWLPHKTYESCNIVNFFISMLMQTVAMIISVGCVTGIIAYIRYSQQETKQKAKNISIWLIIAILQTTILIIGSLWVKEIGMETYWYDKGRLEQFIGMNSFISNAMRITTLVSILTYIISAITYFAKSKKENKEKIKILAKWEAIIAVVVVGLLFLATKF